MDQKQIMSTQQAQRFLNVYCEDTKTKYTIGDYLGSGMLGSVFRLKKINPPVVVKISQDQGKNVWKKLCSREIKIMKLLGGHPNIVERLDSKVFSMQLGGNRGETAVWGDVYLLFMPEYMELQKLTHMKEKLTEAELKKIAIDICKALEHCAANFVLHRDLKPGNIFFDERQGGRGPFLLGDFNAARIFTKDTEGAITTIGTDGFAAPEVMISEEDKEKGMDRMVWLEPGVYNSDVYSLGITLYYLLARKIPGLNYRSENATRELPMLSEDFERIIMKAVRFDPRKRYRTASEMRKELEALEASSETEVYRDNQFVWAKEALLSGKLEEAELLAKRGVDLGEENCRLVLAYCRCIQVCKDNIRSKPEQFWNHAKPVAAELFEQYNNHKNAMALFLVGLLCQKSGMNAEFCRYMQAAAEQDCVPAMFYWGKILNEELFGKKGQVDLGREYMLRSAEAEFKPALRYVKKYLGMHANEWPEVLRQRLEPVEINEQADMFGAIVRFL